MRACRAPLTHYDRPIEQEIVCVEPPRASPSWKVFVNWTGELGGLGFANVTKRALDADVRTRGPALVGERVFARLSRSLDGTEDKIPGTPIDTFRINAEGLAVEITWTAVWQSPK
ncbi:hypothetical protein BH11MYX1_BH11MYX1_25450 [soil metagenome]